jgi:transcriptional antiterminator NusG
MQIKTGSEERFINLFRTCNAAMNFPIYFLRRELLERKEGNNIRKHAPLFPNYLFVGFNSTDNFLDCITALRHTNGFYRFLPSNAGITPLNGRDLEILLHFIKNAMPIAGISKVFFDADDKIVILEGPLKGLEGNIIKIDRRKKRAKIKLDLYKETFTVNLGFEIIGVK